MNDSLTLFYEQQAYVSSALTISDAKTRQQIKELNLSIKKWLHEELKIFAYLPQEYSDPSRDSKMSPEEVYILDRWRVAESDFVILNMDLPSFGVGQEAEIATSMGIPIIPFHYFKYQVTRILRGIPGIFMTERENYPSDAVISYEDQNNFSDLKEKLLARIKLLQSTVLGNINSDSNYDPFSELLKKAMKTRNESSKSLSEKTGLSSAFIDALLSDYKSVRKLLEPYEIFKVRELRKIHINKYLNPGLWILQRLSESLDIRVSTLIGENELDRYWHEPLKLISKEGVSLEEFVEILEDTDYYISFGKAAKVKKESQYIDSVKSNLLQLVKQKRNAKK